MSRAQTARARLGGTLRQNPGADTGELRRDIAAAKLADHGAEWIAAQQPTADEVVEVLDEWLAEWKPTPDQVARVVTLLSTGPRHAPR